MLAIAARRTVAKSPAAARRALNVAASASQVKLELLDGADAGVALITMDRPEAKNALGRQFVAEFRQAMDQVRYDPKVRVVIVRSVVPRGAWRWCESGRTLW